jgi:hypothetical protein
MNFTYFISVEFLKNNTEVDRNLEDELIRVGIQNAQEVYIQKILGENLYEHLKSQIEADTLTAKEIELLQKHISLCLANYSLYYLLDYVNYKITNRSVVQKGAENAVNVPQSAINVLKNSKKEIGEMYGKKIINFIHNYQNDFPKYFEATNLLQTQPTTKPIQTQIYFRSGRNRNYYS